MKCKIDKLDIEDKLDIDKLLPVSVDMNKLSDVKNDVVQKVAYIAQIKNIEDKITDITNWATNTTLNAKINETKKEIRSITNLATTGACSTVENEMPNISTLVKKSDYDAKMSEIKTKYFTTSDYNKFTSNTLDAKITQKKLVNKYDLKEKREILTTKEEIKILTTETELKADLDKIVKLRK